MTYSSTMAVNRQRYIERSQKSSRGTGASLWGRNQNTTSFRANERTLGPISNTIILVVLACILGLLYLTQVTKTNAYGYQINELRTQQAELKEQNDELEVASARLQALDRVKESETARNLVSVAPTATVQ